MELMKQGAMRTVLSGLLAAFAWPATLLAATDFRPVCWVVNDRKFSARTVFFSHTKPVSSNNPRSYTIVSAPAEQAVYSEI